MRLFILFTICFCASWATAQSKKLKEQLCSPVWLQRPGNVIWNFHENGEIVALSVTVGKNFSINNLAISEAAYIKGTFRIGDSTNTIKVSLDSSFRIFSKDSVLISTNIGTQEWNLITVTDKKLVFSRPPIWNFEKEMMANNEPTLLITLTKGKSRWW